ncbi:hypothetical protein HOH11_00870 [Candidatus Woesearchaeota archaeon]|jgi:hypothetical protein|nr:hypothetical protein [Candidatus Woesearchaeota archaeon]MBT6023142.1 hypothetical protein [Candidatus Woesearchaeota archaeon]
MATYRECKDALVELRTRFVDSKSVAERQVIFNTAISDPDLKDCKTLQSWASWAFKNIEWQLKKKTGKKRAGFFSIFNE